MNKTEFIAAVAAKADITKKDSAVLVNAVLDTIVDTLKNGDDVAITGFGKFSVAEVAERNGHNPSTGEAIVIPAHKAPKFKFASNVKEDIR